MLPGDYYGESLTWFVGRVELVNKITNTAKVRVFGIHTLDNTLISTNDLPDAIIAQNDKSSGSSIYLDPGNVVTGFFLDGRSAQMPVITGRITQGIEGGNFGDRSQGGSRLDIPGADSPKQESVPDQGPDRPGIPGPDGQAVAQQAYNYFRSKFDAMGKSGDWGHMATSAIVGSIRKESQFDPQVDVESTVVNGVRRPEGKTGSYGLHQWNDSRLEGPVGLRGIKPLEWPTAQAQIEFIWWEFTNQPPAYGFPRLKASTTLAEACDAMAQYGRGAGDWVDGRVVRDGWFINESGNRVDPWKQRYGYAKQIYTKEWDLESNYTPIVTPTPSVPGAAI